MPTWNKLKIKKSKYGSVFRTKDFLFHTNINNKNPCKTAYKMQCLKNSL